MRRVIILTGVAAGLVVLYLMVFAYVVAFVAIQPTPSWLRETFTTRQTEDLTWLFTSRMVAFVLASVPFAFVIARVYRRVGVPVAIAVAAIVWATVEASSLIQSLGDTENYVRSFIIADSVELLATLPLLVWLIQHLPSNKSLERSRDP